MAGGERVHDLALADIDGKEDDEEVNNRRHHFTSLSNSRSSRIRRAASSSKSSHRAMDLIDSHCHLQFPSLTSHLSEIIQRSQRNSVQRFVLCGVTPNDNDWEAILSLSNTFPDLIRPQFGLHPWWIDSLSSTSSTTSSLPNWQIQLQEFLGRVPGAGVGECGLDKMISKRVPLSEQRVVLRAHLRLAMELCRPVTIHCVQAWGSLLSLLQEEALTGSSDHPLVMVLHSCNRLPSSLVTQFLQFPQLYFSFNGQRRLTSAEREMARHIPLDRLLLESDSPDQRPSWSLCELLVDMGITSGEALEEFESAGSPDRDSDRGGDRNEDGGGTKTEGDCHCGSRVKSGKKGEERRGRGGLNEPTAVLYACYALAEALEVCPQSLAEVTTQNALRVFWFTPQPLPS
jgi:TatD DNase family protein